MATDVDTIEREILIEAPLSRVWNIVTRAEHLGTWFADAGAEIDLRPGGVLTLTWKEYGAHDGRVETVEPPHTFAFRWALRTGEPITDGNSTLVVFTLSAEGESTRLKVVESGFTALAVDAAGRAKHIEENTQGWRAELDELRVYAESAGA
ncbi:SRPBCC family protein [Phytoactinopolyspora halotolerans]|uniref:Activator of HSP90 ATPase n=1 Tax=Phytoactinopolyspora halotolerans TaxID=1981512 RepID=A0A6L9S7X3_9ACTN|nr:SRPBCC family protein [Phytoactinopolyspora halotolerans]NEE01093.1 activator of HSP90 ATPase [Phytoactinopolyspora halotolerans]